MGDISISELTMLARQAVRGVGEWDGEMCLGNCYSISSRILHRLEGLGLDVPGDVRLVEPLIFRDGGFGSGQHFSLYLPRRGLVVDTQVWQYVGKCPTPLDGRRVVFTRKEYSDLGFSI